MAEHPWRRVTSLRDIWQDVEHDVEQEERNDPPCDIDSQGLYLGSVIPFYSITALEESNFTHILTVAPLVFEIPGIFKCLSIPVQDSENENIAKYFAKCFAFIEEAKRDGGRVLVHCIDGVSPSATIVISYLMVKQNLSLTQAVDLVKRARPIASPNPGFMAQLEKFDRTRNDKLVKITFKVAVAKRRFKKALSSVVKKLN